jgi:hypothetical protein
MTEAEWYENGLEKVAQTYQERVENGKCVCKGCVQELLNKKLGPLLAAGQAMREAHDGLYAAVHANDINPADPLTVQAWDAAKAKLLGGAG